jgi:hypothetical protein
VTSLKFAIILAAPLLLPQPSRSLQLGTNDAGGDSEQHGSRSARVRTVAAKDDLQAALNNGGEVRLTPGATYPGMLTGSPTGPALDIPIGTHDVEIFDLSATTTHDQGVIRVGRNDRTQTTLELVPQRITFTRVKVPTYRGKRAFEINAANVTLTDCIVADVYDPGGRDSQAIEILNAPGPVLVQGGSYSAGSEVIMIGGDEMKIPGVVPTGITIRDSTLWRPLEWQTDGVSRTVKNLIELKTGRNVLVQRVRMDGSWKNGQDGYAVVITPRAGGDIHDVTIEDTTIDHVAGGFNILGADSSSVTPSVLSGVVIRRVKVTTAKAVYGGRGILALITGGPHDVTFDDVTAVLDGNCIVYVDKSSGAALQPDGTKKPAGNMASLVVTNSRLVPGIYGFIFTGNVRGKLWQNSVDALTVTANTLADAPAEFKKNFPRNTYVDRATFDALVAGK